ncbi:MAG TPA: AMP-binding protein, partial [Acidimicrobiales bacterium]|nr:AMP-binding protein [Acidimicrobiales bacterium]
MILDHAAARPDELAVDDLARTRTWAQLIDRAHRLGHLLRDEHGVGPGDHVSMLMGNRVEFPELVLASVLTGIWITPINWHLTADEVAYILDDSGAKVLVTDPAFEATARAAVTRAAAHPPMHVAGDDLDRAVADASDAPFALDGPAGGTMMYTSGTTGRPKGVKRPRASGVEATLRSLGDGPTPLGLEGSGPHLVTGPLYHSAPGGFAQIDLHHGAPLVLMSRWDEEATLRLIDDRGVVTTHLVPTMFVRLLRLPDDVRASFDGSSLRTVIHGAAPVAPQVKARMIEWWGPVLLEYWGSTEGGVFTLVGSQDWLDHPGTVGRALPSYEVFAVDEDGTRLPPGEVGTLYTRNLLTTEVFEYHNAPEKTAGAHLAPGTFTMGDVGRVDDDGFVHLSDRSANMIISGGVNIYPAEIEAVLHDHPAIADVAVFGIPDDEWGEQVKAAVQLREGVAPSEQLADDIMAFARERLAGYK